MFKRSHTLLRRAAALLMCVCMVMGNISVAVSSTIEFFSEPVRLTTAGRNAASGAEVPLSDYAKFSYTLAADRNGTALPDVVGNGQSLFFQLAFDLKKQEGLYLLRQAYQNGLVDQNTTFTADISFLNLLKSHNYPTSFDSPDNIASDGDVNIFRWWVNEATGEICLRFYENVYTGEGDVSNTKVAFEGTLDTSGHDDNGKLNFGVDGTTTSLVAKQEYDLSKTAGIPYYSVDDKFYLVDYTVTLTLDQNMKLSASTDMYGAALTLVDTVVADGALDGLIVGDPVITAPTDETATATVAQNGTENTLTLSSPDGILNKGIYTIVYKMKVNSTAAFAKLEGYSDAQKTNTVEVQENGASLSTPLTATATIAWDEVTENQFKIDKNAFTEKAPDFKGVYRVVEGEGDEAEEKFYIDYRVVVYIREPVHTFTVTDAPQYAVGFRTDVPITLEGVDSSSDYWTKDVNAASLDPVVATVTTEIQRLPLGHENAMANCQVITITAPEGELLAPGAYHLRIPADVTNAVASTRENNYPQYYSNTAYLTSVDGVRTNENKEFKQHIPEPFKPSKSGGYEVNQTTGELLFHEGKPVIRWDVWLGWDFYDLTTFEDTLTGMELLVNDQYTFDIHSFTDPNHIKQNRLASLNTLTDTNYLDFNADGTGFTMYAHNLDKNPDGTPVKLYKLVYFTTPLDEESDIGYLTTGLKNSYEVTHKTPSGNGFSKEEPFKGESEPTLSSNARLTVRKAHVIERNDSLTQWKITCANDEKRIPFKLFSNLDIVDMVPVSQNANSIGEVTVHYSNKWPITVEMVCENNAKVTLTEGTHYNILKQHPQYDFGTDGAYGFAVDLNMETVADVLAANSLGDNSSTYFKTIDVLCYLNNETHPSGNNYRIYNEGHLYYTNQGQEIKDSASAHYDRGFATKWKGVHPYEDNYNPNSPRRYYVANTDENGNAIEWQDFTGGYNHDPAIGDGLKEIVWRIFIGAREFGNDNNPITVTVTDTFSDNQMFPTYEGKELKDQFLIRAEDNMDYIILPDSVVVNGNTFTLTFTVPGGAWAGQYKSADIIIDYHTILKPEAIKEALDQAPDGSTSVTVPYDNIATVSWNGDSYTLPKETSSATFSTSMLDKRASIVTAVSEIEYSIVINENRLPLNEGKPLVLTDTLGTGKEGFLYRDDSIRLVNPDTGVVLTAGNAVTDSTYTITWETGDTKGFTLGVPDGQKLLLTYRVKPQAGIGKTTDELTNSASLDGQTVGHVQKGFQVNASNQEATYTPPEGTAAVKIRKLEGGGSIQILLQGATFAAYPVKADGTLGKAVQTLTTDATGCATFKFQRNGDEGYDTVYCIKEVSAPAGYVASSAEWYFYFRTESKQYANAEVESIVNLLLGNGKNVQQVMNQTVHQENVVNMPVTCDLLLYKQSETGDFLSGAVFVLQDANGNTIAGPTETVVDGKTVYLFTDLKGGNYTLTETKAPAGYVCGEISQWSITLDAENKSVSVNWEEGTSEATRAYVTTSTGDNAAVLAITNDEAAPGELVIPVVKMLNGTNSTDQVFTFKLWTEDSTAPMPAGSNENAECFVTTSGAIYTAGTTTVSFPAILFDWDTVGKEYSYFVKEEAVAASTGFTMADADAVYQLIVKPEWDDDEAEIVVAVEACYYKGTTQHDGDLAFENIYEPTVSLEGQKYWNDQLNSMGTQPEEITIKLMNGTTQVQSCIASAANGWKFQFDNLPRFDEDGNEIQYTIEEVLDEPLNYLPEYSEVTYTNGAFKGDITNHQLVRHTIQKEWDDGDDQDGLRPDSLSVTLTRKLVHEQANEELVIGTYELNDANNWTVTVSEYHPDADDPDATAYLLAYDAWGNAYDYVWSEPTVTDYTPADEPVVTQNKNHITTTLTNSYTPETTEATVVKVWEDKKNQDGKRPESLTVTLSDGTNTVATATLNEANSWTATVKDLPVYADGKKITYTWTEDETALSEGYKLTGNTTDGTITTLTNTHTPETTDLTVKKVWEDKKNQDGLRPATLTVTLSDGTNTVATATLNEANNWTATVKDLPVYADGKEITYTWTEDETALPEGYKLTGNTTDGTITTLTNTHTPEITDLTVKKVWEDKKNQDGKRPESLTVTLSDGTNTVATATLNEANSWTATVKDLPVYADGKKITYTWTEDETALPEGYKLTGNTTDGTITTLTNSYTPEITDLTVKKVWEDENNQDGLRPATLTVTLSNSTKDVATVTLNEANSWTATVKDLPVYADGKKITYTWTEDETALPEGYKLTGNTTDGTITTLTNTHTPEVVSISGTKTWDDLDDACKKRPASITIRLYADNVEVAKQEVTAADNWSWSFTDLPKYEAGKVGHELTYTIAEDSVPGYVATPAGYNLTNSLLVVAFQKLDEQTGNPLSGAEFALYAGRQTTPTGTALETWTADGTPKLLAGLTADEAYTIFETKTPDGFVTMTPYVFTVRQTDTPDNLRTFTAANRHSYRFRKLSSTDGALVYGAQLAIKQGDTTLATWSTSGDNNGWHTVADERFTAGVTYTLVELSAPAGYQLAAPISFSIDPKDGFLIVNGKDTDKADVVMYDQPIPEVTPTPEPTTTSFRVTKRWEDRENVLGLRPNSIVVNLYRKTSNSASYPDTPYLTVTMNSNGTDEWKFTFSDLPLRDADGRLYTYMAQEEPVEGYVAKYLNNGKTIINAIPEEDLPPTPTPTLPYVTPTPSPMPRHPVGVQFIDGQWVYVDEYGVPLGTVPLTGDHTNFTLWGVAIVLPLMMAALAAVEIRRRKRLMAAQSTHEQ